VLVVEDNIALRRYVRDLLAPAYRVLEAGNGREGLEHAQASLPDLIVADVMMPRMDGFEMVQALRQQPSTECIPVVMLTARTGDEAHAQGLDEGADAYLTKPFDAPVLIAQIERLLSARKQLRRRLREEIEEEASSQMPNPAGDGPPAFDEQVRRAVREHLADPDFSVADLAEEVALSRSHLTDKVKDTLGQTPTALLRSMRLERGAELLASETGTVTEVAYAVGFNSLSYFSRCFKEEYGVPPSSYPNEQVT
jgi:DNA-binding response OmpR family regulator